jgi:intein/homing endonuclease
MADNSQKNIETISVGDIVKSYDFKNKKLIDSKVTRLVFAQHSNLLKLKFADNEIVVTSDHPFWIDKNVWAAVDAEKANKDYFQKTKVESLKVGDKVFIPNKMSFSKIIGIENIKEGQITYTIELSESDNFIANGMLVKTETITSNLGTNK